MEFIFKNISCYIGKDSDSTKEIEKFTLNIPEISFKGHFEIIELKAKEDKKKGLSLIEDRAKELIFNYINSKVSSKYINSKYT